MLPLNEQVVAFVHSRTKHGKKQTLAIREMAIALRDIWEKADACPQSLFCIIRKCEQLLKDRNAIMTKYRNKDLSAGCGGESGDGGGAKEFACSGLGPEIANA